MGSQHDKKQQLSQRLINPISPFNQEDDYEMEGSKASAKKVSQHLSNIIKLADTAPEEENSA